MNSLLESNELQLFTKLNEVRNTVPKDDVNDLAILVISCDKYNDLWKPFFSLFWRFWPDCPFPVYLLTNNLVYEDPRVINLPVKGELSDWSGALIKGLDMLKEERVILLLEDFFFRSPVNTSMVASLCELAKRLGAKMLRLVPRPAPDTKIKGLSTVGLIKPGSPYRVSMQAAIWKRDTLMSLLTPGESIWEFELNGTVKSESDLYGYYAVWTPALPYKHHVVERGKWFRWAARKFRRMNIGCDFTKRPIMSRYETFEWLLRKAFSYPLGLVPWHRRRSIMKYLRSRIGST